MITTKPLVRESLALLKLYGVNVAPTVWDNVKCAVFLISYYILVLQSFLNLVLNWKGVDSMYDLTIFGTTCQILAKLNTVAFRRQKICKMLSIMNQFWQVNASHSKIEAIYRSVKKGYIFATFMGICFTIAIYSVCIKFQIFPMPMYYPSTSPKSSLYAPVMVYQVYIMYTLVTGYIGSEYLFFTCITYIVCEFKLIKERILKLSHKFENNGNGKLLLKEFGSIIDQENLVFEFVEIFNSFYSPVVLTIFGTCIFSLSASLSSIVIKSSEGGEVLMMVIMFTYFWILLFGYCLAGNVVMTSSEDVLNGILESNACLIQDAKFQKALMLVMLRSQKLAKIQAGGVFDLDLETFTRVVNSALSFFSLFKATYGKAGRN